MPIRCTPKRSYCTCTSLRNQIVCYRLSLIPIRWRPDVSGPQVRIFCWHDLPEHPYIFPTFLHLRCFLKDMLGYRFPTFLHAPDSSRYSPESSRDPAVFLPILRLYERLFTRDYWEVQRVIFDAPKPADQPVESAREKATKEIGQKASHRPIGVSIGRATRAS